MRLPTGQPMIASCPTGAAVIGIVNKRPGGAADDIAVPPPAPEFPVGR